VPEARGTGAAPGETITPFDERTRVMSAESVRGAGARGAGNPKEVSTGDGPRPGVPSMPGVGLEVGMHVAIGSVPERK
jgi:hypothetical protein